MQREKLYNLHKIPYFTVAFICFENRQNSVRSNFDLAKKYFFRMRWTRFFLIQHLICCVSKRTKYTTGCSVKNSTNYKQQFILTMSFCSFPKTTILWATFRKVQNWSLRILFISKQNVHNQHKIYIVDCTAFHAASSGIVCF